MTHAVVLQQKGNGWVGSLKKLGKQGLAAAGHAFIKNKLGSGTRMAGGGTRMAGGGTRMAGGGAKKRVQKKTRY